MKVDRSILEVNDQSMGMVADPDKLESSITHLANVIDSNDDGKTDKTGDHNGTWKGHEIGDFASQDLTLYAKKLQPSWTNLTLQNGWVNDSGFSTASYRKNEFGEIEIRGRIKTGTTTIGTVIAVLPLGYRPATKKSFAVVCHMGTGIKLGQIDILTNGTIEYVSGDNYYLSLENVPPFATN
jgi:hypothetical protein